MNNFSNLQQQFTNKENLNLLWNVLLDEFNINNSNKKLINNIKIVFESNINPFILKVNPRSNIMELNKLFLSQVVLAVNKLLTNTNTNTNNVFKRITISDENILNEPYKIEDIQASRQNNFDKSLEQKRIDLENYMTPQKPKELNFSDNKSDSKITSMDSLIAEKMAERNLEIKQLHNSNFNTTINSDNWLTPQETSLKNEKTFITKNNENNENSRLKYISIDSNNNITLSINESQPSPQNTTKKVSWNIENEPTLNIFNKLKKQPIKEEIVEPNIDIDFEQGNEFKQRTIQYAEQKSIPLPNVKQEEIIRNQTTIIPPNNEPILPKTEIIRQLNEMNKKIDNLYEIILKLTNTSLENETPI
jgi:hypothetical protein